MAHAPYVCVPRDVFILNHCWLLWCIVCLLGDRNPRFPFASNAPKIWEARNFPLDFLEQVWDIPRAEFSPCGKNPLQKSPPPPPRDCFPPPPPFSSPFSLLQGAGQVMIRVTGSSR